MSARVTNPILPGFNPDPSICRVGDGYYIATSTFEWYPGVQIHHSKDLLNWNLVSRPLNRADLLDMTGCPDSCGVWAPCLSWHDGLFYLVYTDVKRFDGNFKDTHNYLTTSETIDGRWSERIYLNSSGFDPSLFHDDDGKKYLVNMVWDHRPDRSFFGGILLQEYSAEQKKLIGEFHNIFPGSELGLTEGPHLYKWNNRYYLLTAEGGTGYEHAMTLARSKKITGPYELDPLKHFITAKDAPHHKIQRAGHGDIVQTPSGDWYAVHLCSRPLGTLAGKNRRSPMGRETAMEKLVFNGAGWLRKAGEKEASYNPAPQLEFVVETPASRLEAPATQHYDFARAELHKDFQWLRMPDPSVFLSLTDRPGYLRLYGKESLGSLYTSALLARRQSDFCFSAQTLVAFSPSNFQQSAGLVCYYNAHKFHYVYLSWDEVPGLHLNVMSCLGDTGLSAHFPLGDEPVSLPEGAIFLRADINYSRLNFYWSANGEQWHKVNCELDYSLLSDEAGKGEGGNFTGAFVGICCQDLSGQNCPADFRYFEYRRGE